MNCHSTNFLNRMKNPKKIIVIAKKASDDFLLKSGKVKYRGRTQVTIFCNEVEESQKKNQNSVTKMSVLCDFHVKLKFSVVQIFSSNVY